jgi:hypothetical protein
VPKLTDYGTTLGGVRTFGFYCPGCEFTHSVNVGGPEGPVWTWNGSMDSPTFSPSLLIWQKRRGQRETLCHLFVEQGKIRFLSDSRHRLAGQTVEMEDVNA